jgi:hypothetical protein
MSSTGHGTGSSPMNLSLHMTQTSTAASPESTGSHEIAIVIHHGEHAHPPDESGEWRRIETFTPDPTATYTLKTERGDKWSVVSEGVAVFEKRGG